MTTPQPTFSTLDRPTKSRPPRLPPNTTLLKRPLLHPPIPNPLSKKSQQTVYVSAKTPFMSAVKRVRKLLAKQEPNISLDDVADKYRDARNRGNRERNRGGKGGRGGRGGRGGSGLDNRTKRETIRKGKEKEQGDVDGSSTGKKEDVLIKATGKAIDKALNLALYFQGQKDVKVSIRTGTIDAIDDYFRRPSSALASDDPGKEKDAMEDEEFPNASESTALPPRITPDTQPVNPRKRKSAELEDSPDASYRIAPNTGNNQLSKSQSSASFHTTHSKLLKPATLEESSTTSQFSPSPHTESQQNSTSRSALYFYTTGNKKLKTNTSSDATALGSGVSPDTLSASPHEASIDASCPSLGGEGVEGTEENSKLVDHVEEVGDAEAKSEAGQGEEPRDQYSKIRKLSFVEIGVSLVRK